MSLAEAVKTLRSERGWQQEDLAERSGLSRSTVTHIERGRRVAVSQETLTGLARAFGMGVDELLQRAGLVPPTQQLRAMGRPERELRELEEVWDDLPQPFRDAVLASVRAYVQAEKERNKPIAEDRSGGDDAGARFTADPGAGPAPRPIAFFGPDNGPYDF